MRKIVGGLSPYIVFIPLCFGVFIAADDQTVVVTILPDIMQSLKIPATEIDRASWLVISFLIGYSATMPLMGRVTDRWGYRRAFLIALSIFMIGSVGVALSPQLSRLSASLGMFEISSYHWMIVWRVVQSLGAGAVIPISLSAAGELVAPWRRAVAYGMVGASAEAGGVIGPVWGGAVAEWIGWEWAFWLNIPLALIAVIALTRMPRGKSHQVEIDWFGGLVFGAALTTLTFGLFRVSAPDLLMVALFSLSVFFIMMMAVRIGFMHDHDKPPTGTIANRLIRLVGTHERAVPKVLFLMKDFMWANATHFLVGGALMIGLVSVPLMAGTVYNLPALESGLWLLRMTVSIGAAALIGGFITQRYGTRIPTLIGLGLSGFGYWLLSGWTLDIAEPMITINLVIIGAGFGLVIAPIAEGALRRVSEDDRGIGAGVLTLSRNVGMTMGLAVIASLGTSQFLAIAPGLEELMSDADAGANTGLEVFSNFAIYAALACILALIPGWFMSARYSDSDAEGQEMVSKPEVLGA